jgi:DNA repair protein RadA/Sms
LLGVLDKRLGLRFGTHEVYASAVGGVRINEPAADLGITLALASAYSGRPMFAKAVAVGEVGLGGEVRRVANMERRLAEAARLGYTKAIVPASTPDFDGIQLVRVHDVGEAAAPFTAE